MGTRMWIGLFITGATILLCAATCYRLHTARLESRLVQSWPEDAAQNAGLNHLAKWLGTPTYQEHRTSCHGLKLEGNPARGIPNLADGVWLYAVPRPIVVDTTAASLVGLGLFWFLSRSFNA